MENYYQLLGVAYYATDEQIKRAYKQKAKEYHPDVSKIPNAAEIFKEVNNAKDILLDPKVRLEYDYHIGVKTRSREEQAAYDHARQQEYQQYYQQQPQTQGSGKQFWFVVLLLFILALIFGSSERDRRRY